MALNARYREVEQRVAITESTLAQWQATVWAKQIEERVAALERVHTERLDMHVARLLALEDAAMSATDFKVHLGLRERVQALEQENAAQEACHTAIDCDECPTPVYQPVWCRMHNPIHERKPEPQPLPQEELE